jgi:hypothetical protein
VAHAEESSTLTKRRKTQIMRQGVLKAYRDRDEVALKIALLSAGWSEESPEFAEALQVFRDAISRLPAKRD